METRPLFKPEINNEDLPLPRHKFYVDRRLERLGEIQARIDEKQRICALFGGELEFDQLRGGMLLEEKKQEKNKKGRNSWQYI